MSSEVRILGPTVETGVVGIDVVCVVGETVGDEEIAVGGGEEEVVDGVAAGVCVVVLGNAPKVN